MAVCRSYRGRYDPNWTVYIIIMCSCWRSLNNETKRFTGSNVYSVWIFLGQLSCDSICLYIYSSLNFLYISKYLYNFLLNLYVNSFFSWLLGVDVAFVKRGYVYHTKYDNFENVENGSYQHIGDNILELTRAIANSDELKDPQQHDSGHLIFYDFFGLTLIIYSYICGIILNLFIVILSLYTCFAYIRGITKGNI